MEPPCIQTPVVTTQIDVDMEKTLKRSQEDVSKVSDSSETLGTLKTFISPGCRWNKQFSCKRTSRQTKCIRMQVLQQIVHISIGIVPAQMPGSSEAVKAEPGKAERRCSTENWHKTKKIQIDSELWKNAAAVDLRSGIGRRRGYDRVRSSWQETTDLQDFWECAHQQLIINSLQSTLCDLLKLCVCLPTFSIVSTFQCDSLPILAV